MKDFFKPEDFNELSLALDGQSFIRIGKAAELANVKLAELIESAPSIFGNKESAPFVLQFSDYTPPRKATHRAKLMFIEELVKKPCKHEPIRSQMTGLTKNKCKHCGVELIADWKAK